MTEREALLAAVCANPDDDTPRLVFADLLQENGEEARAEFIRLQVRHAELARLAAPGVDAVGRRARELWLQHGKGWREELPQIDGIAWHDAFCRGFVEQAVIANDALVVRHADTIFNQAPLLHLVFLEFEAANGFVELPGLCRLRTLSLTNSHATEDTIRRLVRCEQLAESMLLFCSFGQSEGRFYSELRAKFGQRLQRPTNPSPRIVGVPYRGGPKGQR